MNIRDKIKREIEKQKSIEGEKCQYEILLKFLSVINTDNQWRDFVNCEFYSYGILSYQSHRFYYPKKELIDLINIIRE